MKIYALIAAAILVLFVVAAVGSRIAKDIRKKVRMPNTYAILNAGTGKAMRVKDAGIADGTEIIQYSHNKWECITWQFIQMPDGSFLLNNCYTLKAIQASAAPNEGVGLSQQPAGGTTLQLWEFLEQPDATFLIRLKGTELYATATSSEQNSPIILEPRMESPMQLWRKVRQSPWI